MAQAFTIETPTGERYEKRPDGETLYELMIGGDPKQGHDGHHAHDWCVTLESLYDEGAGRLGYVQTVTFQGKHLGPTPREDDYRKDVILQLLSANAEPVEMALSWNAAKHLRRLIDIWEQEHPDVTPAHAGDVPTFSRN